jgi:hypothetical protein
MDADFFLWLEYNNRIRVRLLAERGNLLKVLCQYESLIDGDWTPIVRYDSAHGFFHKDILYRDGTKEKRDVNYIDLNSAFNYARDDLENNWRSYLYRYMTQNGR